MDLGKETKAMTWKLVEAWRKQRHIFDDRRDGQSGLDFSPLLEPCPFPSLN